MRTSNRDLLLAFLLAAGVCIGLPAYGVEVKAHLSGADEVPPVATPATGECTLTIADDGSVRGSIVTKGIDGTMAHIHLAAMGQNGPVIVKLVKDGDGTFKTPEGAKLDPAQMQAFKAGELYVNVHSASHKSGEIRGQLK